MSNPALVPARRRAIVAAAQGAKAPQVEVKQEQAPAKPRAKRGKRNV